MNSNMRKKSNYSGGGRHQNRGRRNHGRSGGNDSQSLGRQKKHATTQKEKYQNMARDAQGNGDRVQAEYYLQHVEHYERTLQEILAKEGERDAKREEQKSAPKTHHIPPAPEANASEPDEQIDDVAVANGSDEKEESTKKTPRKRAPRAKVKPKDAEIPLPASVIPEAEGNSPAAASSASEA